MKLFRLLLSLLIIFTAFQAFGTNKNQSVDYVRTMNRNASTDIDATYYNPAGLTKLKKDGFTFQVSNQSILQTKKIEDSNPSIQAFGDDNYEGDVNAYFFPDFHGAYKMGKLVFFTNIMPIGGGGGGTYDEGLPQFELIALGSASAIEQGVVQSVVTQAGATDATSQLTDYSSDLSFEGTEYNIAWTLGTAYEINKTFSVAGAYRLTRAYRYYKGHAKNLTATTAISGSGSDEEDAALTSSANDAIAAQIAGDAWEDVELETEGIGWGHTFILGTNVSPMDSLNIGFKVEYSLEMEREYELKKISGSETVQNALKEKYGDGVKEKITDPIQLSTGISYFITDDLRVEADLTYSLDTLVDHDGREDDYKNMIFTGAAVEYRVLPQLLTSVGYAYDSGNRDDAGREETNFGLPVHHIAGGIRYTIMEDLDLGVGFIHSMYTDGERTYTSSDGTEYTQKVKQTSETLGIGITYSL